jgi:mRNA-degrading endonuclease toxin of MazEF toxin-antitoxin module
VANVSQIITVDKEQLVDRVGAIPPSLHTRIEEGLRLVFGFGP